MSNHVFVWAAGFGLTVVPFTPYEMRYGVEGEEALDVGYSPGGNTLFARVIADREGGYRSKLSQHTKDLFDVVEIAVGPDIDRWRIETTLFTVDWPKGYVLYSTAFPDDPVLIQLANQEGDVIYIQSANKAPSLRQLVAPGQRIIHLDETARVVEVEYDHDGKVWYQRHQKVTKGEIDVVFTTQSYRERSDGVAANTIGMANSLTAVE